MTPALPERLAREAWEEISSFAPHPRELAAIAAAIRAALKERDFEWWEACALVDNVAPTPEAVKAWQIAVCDLAATESRRAALDEAAKVARGAHARHVVCASTAGVCEAHRIADDIEALKGEGP